MGLFYLQKQNNLMEKEIFQLLKKTKLIKSLEMRGYLQNVNGEYIVSEKLQETIDEVSDTDWILEEYREKFSYGVTGEAGKMGDSTAVVAKMQRFMLTHPELTKEIILEATDMYIQSVTNTKYLKQADYFIFKKESHSDVETSTLYGWVEELQRQIPKSDGDKII
jgi:hypothetical protein